MNNAIFGKTVENMCSKSCRRKIINKMGRYGAKAMIAKPNFHSCSVFAENLIAVELQKLEVKFNKPIYVYSTYRKSVCMNFITYISPMYRDKCKIMYTDTNSLIYHTECDDAYETMEHNIARFDTSNYPANNAYSIPFNKKVPGLMKDKNNGAIMIEFNHRIGLRAKMYAVKVDSKNDTKKAKGVKSNIVARMITFDDYT